MKTSFVAKIILTCSIICAAQQTVQASAPQAAKASYTMQSFAQDCLQKGAAIVTIGGIAYGTYELMQAIKHWTKIDDTNPEDEHRELRN